MDRKAVLFGRLISLGIALFLAGTFFAITTLAGDYNSLARYGGAVWVFLLTLIIALPIITPLFKRRFKG